MVLLIIYLIGSLLAEGLYIADQCISVKKFEPKQLLFGALQLIGSWACVAIGIYNIIIDYKN